MKVLKLDIANMDEEDIIDMLNKNNVDIGALCGILESLFHMFQGSLKCSATIAKYGMEHHEDFLETFIKGMDERGHNVGNLLDLVRSLKDPNATSSSIH